MPPDWRATPLAWLLRHIQQHTDDFCQVFPRFEDLAPGVSRQSGPRRTCPPVGIAKVEMP
jgi:hypothetical protein